MLVGDGVRVKGFGLRSPIQDVLQPPPNLQHMRPPIYKASDKEDSLAKDQRCRPLLWDGCTA